MLAAVHARVRGKCLALAQWAFTFQIKRLLRSGTTEALFDNKAFNYARHAFTKQAFSAVLLRSAREARANGHWIDCATLWLWYARASSDHGKAISNLTQAARQLTGAALPELVARRELWRRVLQLDSGSAHAADGLIECDATLARLAEESGDTEKAQQFWSEIIGRSFNNQVAVGELARLLKLGPELSSMDPQDAYDLVKERILPDFFSQIAAGRVLLAADMPAAAFRFANEALKHGGSEGRVLLFCCQVQLSQYTAAVLNLEILVRDRVIGSIPPNEICRLLDQEVAGNISSLALESLVKLSLPGLRSRLLPVLVSQDLSDSVIALADEVEPEEEGFSIDVVLGVAEYLRSASDTGRSLKFLALFAGRAEIKERLSELAPSYDSDDMDRVLAEHLGSAQRVWAVCLTVAEICLHRDDKKRAVAALQWATAIHGAALQAYYAQSKLRFASLVQNCLRQSGGCHVLRGQLAAAVSALVSEPAKEFFAGPEYGKWLQYIVERQGDAASASREEVFREHYFEHHMERRESQSLAAFETEHQFCSAVFQYFIQISRMQMVEDIPISTSALGRLNRPHLRFTDSRSASLLMTTAMLRDAPHFDVASGNSFEQAAAWFATEFAPANQVPSACMPQDVIEALNVVTRRHSEYGISVTRFLELLNARWRCDAQEFDLSNDIDALLFTLTAVARFLADAPQWQPLLRRVVQERNGKETFFDTCIAILAKQQDRLPAFSHLLNRGQQTAEGANRSGVHASPAGKSVLLIGYSGAGTGLNRNLRMIAAALERSDIPYTTLEYDDEAEQFACALRQWRQSATGAPVVIAATNAHDIPALFIKDRFHVLYDCAIAGFFLWETSKAPRTQYLGISLVDEIWAPTQYVADIYRPFDNVHVVGKGLVAEDMSRHAIRRIDRTSMRFLTFFDFHSSIERKNPLASILAFKQAFTAGENVELVLKTSSINPEHPTNAGRHWERVLQACDGDSRITIVAERFGEEEMQAFLGTASCLISLHRAEGFGYLPADAMTSGIPVIATDYSGNTDFCDEENSYPVAYRLVHVNAGRAHWEDEDTYWAEPDIGSAALQMRRVYADYTGALGRAATGKASLFERYSMDAFSKTVSARIANLQRKTIYRYPAST